MVSILIVKDTPSKKGSTSIIQLGLKALNLALVHKAEIDARQPGIIERISEDLDAMGVVVPGAVQARHEAIVATSAQNVLVEEGYARVRAIRETVRKSGALQDVRRAYGVGQKIDPDRVRDVKAALQQIVDRATDEPEEAATFGLIPGDVAAMATFITTLVNADSTQEKKRASAPLSTKERNRTGNQILQSVALISGAGRIAFAGNPTTFASFDALVAPVKKTAAERAKAKAKAKGKNAAPTKAAESSASEASKASVEASSKPSVEASKPSVEASKPPVEAPKSSVEASSGASSPSAAASPV
jgi:hypothetical protein